MSDLYFFNTLNRKKELFIPIKDDFVKMYVCGPTVYGDPHIGNARPAIVFDLLYRVLIKKYGIKNVVYVRNITDVDDKINNEVKKQKISHEVLIKNVTKVYHDNLKDLCVLSPNFEPKVSEHIKEIISFISGLIEKKYAYIKNEHVFFDVSKYAEYGKLSNQNLSDLIDGVRIEISKDKEDSNDFVLWKPSDSETIGWESPWGYGRPGWHIECSAMSLKYLGETFDIHGGGIDLVFPHHENEIAQSTCLTDKKMANFWIHNGLININNEKMSKSLGNFLTVNSLLEKWDGAIIRLALISSHYRSQINWTDDLLKETKEKITKWSNAIKNVSIAKDPEESFFAFLYDDLNTPKALAYLSNLYKLALGGDIDSAEKLLGGAMFLGIDLKAFYKKLESNSISDLEVQKNIDLRNKYRAENDFVKADQIRVFLKEKGIDLLDKNDKTDWIRG
ncbi:MAG TPA: cysteine--tRNA ligase [Candidatus Paceibacterota bacterium]|nr:cysteine--tRNA ligase [Candidatus Paceibacterota bacterium]HMP18885.1 cysteine--tRNA ligase [Candidatus Paceibacterota bacterium]HMP85046.1 cysteine--tRNA ligase [Candidatus Paceibacterota bacterium]